MRTKIAENLWFRSLINPKYFFGILLVPVFCSIDFYINRGLSLYESGFINRFIINRWYYYIFPDSEELIKKNHRAFFFPINDAPVKSQISDQILGILSLYSINWLSTKNRTKKFANVNSIHRPAMFEQNKILANHDKMMH